MTLLRAALAALGAALAAGDTSTCATDTWGLTDANASKPYTPGVIQSLDCHFNYVDPGTLDRFSANFYPDFGSWNAFKGVDLLPERNAEYPRTRNRWGTNLRLWQLGRNGPPAQRERLRFGECEVPQADGGALVVQRIGPFNSTGSYDYWQVGWRDVWRMGRVLQRHPEGVVFTEAFSGGVLPNGTVLGFPPIHIHHIHVTPEPGVKFKLTGSGLPVVVNLVFEQHGDYECTPMDGGSDCLLERTPDGYARLVTTPLDLEGELNDVRAPGSEPMTWWYQVVVRWHPRTSALRALSQLFTISNGLAAGDQTGTLLTFPASTGFRSVLWYTGRMPVGGTLLRNKIHAHGTLFHSAFWFRATATDLGLVGRGHDFNILDGYRPQLLANTGFGSFEELEAYLQGNLAEAAAAHDVDCRGGAEACSDHRPALVCSARASTVEEIDPRSGRPFAYDRRAPTCCRPWHFSAGEIVTIVAFMAPPRTNPGPWSPNSQPPELPMHIHWVTSYDTQDGRSHYSFVEHGQDADTSVIMGDAAELPLLFPHGQTVANPRGWRQPQEAGGGQSLLSPRTAVRGARPSPYEDGLPVDPTRSLVLFLLAPMQVICVVAFASLFCSICCWRVCDGPCSARAGPRTTIQCVVEPPCCPVIRCKQAQRNE